MKIKEQAMAALKLDPFAKVFTCDKVCAKKGCNCYVRRTTGCFDCLECNKARTKKYRELNPKKVAAYNRAWYEENRDYLNTRRRANCQLKAESNARLQSEQAQPK